MDYFEQLGVGRDATTIEIKKAYRKLANKFHPDKNNDSSIDVEEQFQLIKTAYDTLSDPKKRTLYLKSNYTLITDPREVADSFWQSALS
ncbi:DnaJ domain-containing protein [Colwellia sp. E2M01]|uniref:DnaJ domain-containing protein n=1 Tax=Colwellia sp. E2M01 TaxID=2841561 RepID=UPI001C08B49C|nr:DnaJ domain-containing protein [Colwellia sp. E2M01]MBU2869459.1 DnaJ domain-containing protein [Colwellia sp. E2M01]